jgi:ABC-type multidrug transport system permease subunit
MLGAGNRTNPDNYTVEGNRYRARGRRLFWVVFVLLLAAFIVTAVGN